MLWGRILGIIGLIGLAGCSPPAANLNSTLNKRNLVDQVNSLLTEGECTEALELVLPYYNSTGVDNDIRLVTAGAHGCYLGIQFFTFLLELVSSDLTGGGFWSAFAALFPSTLGDDNKYESALAAMDILQSALKPTAILNEQYSFNLDTFNPASVFANDRIDDANTFLLMISMAVIGTAESRYGLPSADESYRKTAYLPWTAVGDVTADGCAYVGSILNMFDSLSYLQENSNGSVQSAFETIAAGGAAIEAACVASCGVACPAKLRSRTLCMDDADSKCAVAAITTFINLSPVGWQCVAAGC